MSRPKKSGSASTITLEPEPTSDPGPITGAPLPLAAGEAVDSSSEKDYWHVNYQTRPYYKEGRSFGDYEAAYRYGWENSLKDGEMTFEEAEKAHLAAGWATARGKSPFAWDDVREATRDAWIHARGNRKA